MREQGATDKPRIVLYGAGHYGAEFTRLARLKGWPIVAALNRAGSKVGQDLWRLAGFEEDSGVVVQDCEGADLARVDADVGVVFTTDSLEQNFPAYERLLNAGLDVVCHGVQAYYPWRYDPETAARIDALAKANGKTFTGTGIWDMSRIWAGVLLAGPCVTIRSLRHETVTQVNYPSVEMVRRFGLELTPEAYRERFVRRPDGVQDYGLAGRYQSIPEQVLTALGFTVTAGAEVQEPITSEQPVYCKALQRDIEPGRVVGWRYRSTVETHEGVRAEARMDMRLLRDDEREQMVWEIDGVPGARLVIERRDSITASAASVLNRIPDVIAAEPGIRLLSQLGPMRPRFPLGPVAEATTSGRDRDSTQSPGR
jgi:4-hydroxy-tetrahydrodipicolinate reductase